MKLRFFILLAIFTIFGNFSAATAQVDSIIGQFTNSPAEAFAGGISGNGRFVVFESRGNLATENPRNADNNREIFLFDYAQRRIFQITDTKSLQIDQTKGFNFDNIRVEIANIRPVISNDGRWIAFGSNATTSSPTAPNNTNPGNFHANSFNDTTTTGTPPTTTTTNPLTSDGNLEIWLYRVPETAPADLTTGEELPLTNLSAGTFTPVTNTIASRAPIAGTTTTGSFIADDNHDASINDDGSLIAFVSTRNFTTANSLSNSDGNDEIFTYVRSSNSIAQVTNTPRGSASNPIYSVAPTISGPNAPGGNRVAFSSNAGVPIPGMTASNGDNNEEIFYTDLAGDGSPINGTAKQITTTTQTTPGDIVNVWNFGRRMSRDGRYIAFDSYAELEPAGTGASTASFALYVYDTTTGTFRRVGPRSDADSGAGGGDVARYPGFTDYTAGGTAQTLVFSSRLNLKADGTIPATASEGLNPNAARPVQIYSYPLNQASSAATFTRLTALPSPTGFLASTQAIPSDSVKRITFNLGLTETGTGNPDLLPEAFYLLLKDATAPVTATLNYETGASRMKVSASPVPTPTPGTTPTPSPSPTPQTPEAVYGVSPGLLTYVSFSATGSPAIAPRTAVGSLSRSFTLPIELSGVTVSVNGVAAGIKSVSSGQIEFVVPPGLAGSSAGTKYPVIINNNGTVIKSEIVVVQARPDIFTNLEVPGPGGRARIRNATNTVLTPEPFTVTTFKRRGSRRVQTVLRLYLTGVHGLAGSTFTIRIGSATISGALVTSNAVLVEPGVYAVDFTLPATLNRAGDQPVIVSVTIGGVTYTSRLDDTAPRTSIL
ncbi:MAG: hypothetical protein JWN60_3086 [Acidobacteria bacterium]|nr:hypothetical protein [Acidobacteriota bacterium]